MQLNYFPQQIIYCYLITLNVLSSIIVLKKKKNLGKKDVMTMFRSGNVLVFLESCECHKRRMVLQIFIIQFVNKFGVAVIFFSSFFLPYENIYHHLTKNLKKRKTFVMSS